MAIPVTAPIFQNPLRPPEWIWLRANRVYDGTEPAPSELRDSRNGQYWITTAVNFLADVRRCQTNADLSNLAERQPALYEAMVYFMIGGTTRAALEAGILAGERRERLAGRYRTTVQTIRTYEAIFFDVRTRRRNQGVILHLILGTMGWAGLAGSDGGTICKLFGYFLGAPIVKAMANNFDPTLRCRGDDDIQATLRADTTFTIALRAAAAAKTMVVTPGNQKFWVEQLVKVVEIEKISRTGDQANSRAGVSLNDMLQQFQFYVGGCVPQTGMTASMPVPIALFEQTAAELSPTDMTALSVGDGLPDAAMLRTLRHPDRLPAPE